MKVRNILGIDFTSGDYVTCNISNHPVFGRIYFDDRCSESMWICHNYSEFDGSVSPDKLGMTYSWIFRYRNNYLTDDISSLNKFLKISQKNDFVRDEKITNFFQSIDKSSLGILMGFKTGQFDDFNKVRYIDTPGTIRLLNDKKFVDIKISRFIRAITNPIKDIHESYSLNDKQIESIYNKYVAFQNNKLFEVKYLKGQDILKAYTRENYAGGGGPLHNSCMTDYPEFLKLYTNNKNVELAVISNDDKIIARCIVWTLTNGRKAFDRIYHSYEWSKEFLRQGLLEENLIDITDTSDEFVVELEEAKFEKYPYVDTLFVLDLTKKVLTNRRYSSTLCLRNTNGGFSTH